MTDLIVEPARQAFEQRLEGQDLSKSSRGFYLNRTTWKRWQDFWAGWTARGEQE